MAETTQDATVIENEVAEVSSESSSLNLPLILGAIALLLSLVALFFALSSGNSGSNTDQVTALENRLAQLESAAPGDLSAVQNEIAAVKADLSTVEANLASTVDAINAEFNAVKADMAAAMVPGSSNAEVGGSDAAVLSGLAGNADQALGAVTTEIESLTTRFEDSLGQISNLATGLTENQELLTALGSRVESAEGALAALPAQIDEKVASATTMVQDVQSASTARFEEMQASISDGMAAFGDLSTKTDSAFAEAQTAVNTQFEEVKTGVADQIGALTSSMEAAQAEATEQFATLYGQVGNLSEEFTAMKETSVETSTKVLAVNQLSDALASSAPVRPHMKSLEALRPTEEPLLLVLEKVNATADLRVPTQKILAETIRDLTPRLINETRVNSAEGTAGKALARLGSLVTVERVEDIASIPGIEGNMARAAARIEENDFDAALAELQDDTVEMNLTSETQARYDMLALDLGNRATYEAQRRILSDWVTNTLFSARSSASNN